MAIELVGVNLTFVEFVFRPRQKFYLHKFFDIYVSCVRNGANNFIPQVVMKGFKVWLAFVLSFLKRGRPI